MTTDNLKKKMFYLGVLAYDKAIIKRIVSTYREHRMNKRDERNLKGRDIHVVRKPLNCSYAAKLPIYVHEIYDEKKNEKDRIYYRWQGDLEGILPSKVLENINSKVRSKLIRPESIKSKEMGFTEKDRGLETQRKKRGLGKTRRLQEQFGVRV